MCKSLPECEQQLDRGLLRACALGWAVVAAPVLLQPDVVTLDVFGLDVSGYGGSYSKKSSDPPPRDGVRSLAFFRVAIVQGSS